MQVNITARHCNVPGRVRAAATERLQRLERYEPRVQQAVVEFDLDHGDKLVETRIFVAGSHSIVAHGSGDTFRSALDKSIHRLTSQLKRRRDRIREHKSVKLTEAIAPEGRTVRENTDD